MNNMDIHIKLKKTHENAVLPAANNKELGTGDTGFDMVAVKEQTIPAGGSAVVEVGLTLADISPGYWIRIEPRSGLGFKHSIQPHIGVIDNGYRGDLGVKLYNFNRDKDYQVSPGDKIAQLAIYPLIQPTFKFTDDITDTSRGDRGFGSSDKTTSACDNTVNVENRVDIDPYWSTTGPNPWEFTNVDDLLKWCKSKPEIDDEMFQDLLANTIKNRDTDSNIPVNHD